MQAVWAIKSDNLPPPVCLTTWNNGIVVAHTDGSFTVFDTSGNRAEKGPERLSTIINTGQQIALIKADGRDLYVSFQSGLLAKYTLPTGLLVASIDLHGQSRGIYIHEDSVVVWGTGAQLLILNSLRLDLVSRVSLQGQPLRVTFDTEIAVVLSSGHIQRTDRNWDPRAKEPLPLETFKSISDLDGQVVRTKDSLIDAIALGSSRWILVQRHFWTLCEYSDGEFHVEFTAPGPDPFTSCEVSPMGIISILCDNGRIVQIEGNNMQVIESIWPISTLIGFGYDNEYLIALLSDLTLHHTAQKDARSEWSHSFRLAPIDRLQWVSSGKTLAHGKDMGKLVNNHGNTRFDAYYAAPADITAAAERNGCVYIALDNGSVERIRDGKREAFFYLTATPIRDIKVIGKYLVAWSLETAAVLDENDNPSIIPLGKRIKDVHITGNTFSGKLYDGTETFWDLKTGDRAVQGVTENERSLPSSIRSPRGFQTTKFEKDILEINSDIGVSVGLGTNHTTALFVQSSSLSDHFIPLITALVNHGNTEITVDEKLQQIEIEVLEDLLVIVARFDSMVHYAILEILQQVWTSQRLAELMQRGGMREFMVLGTAYPEVQVGDWLKATLRKYLNGTLTEKIAALSVLGLNPRFLPIPFDSLKQLGNVKGPVHRYARDLASDDTHWFVQTLQKATHEHHSNIPLCVEMLEYALDDDLITPKDDAFMVSIHILVRALDKNQAGNRIARDILAKLRKKYDKNLIFNRERQRLVVMAPIRSGFAETFDFVNGNIVTLGAPPVPVDKVNFTEAGKAIEAYSGDKRYLWRFQGSVVSLFNKADRIEPIESTPTRS